MLAAGPCQGKGAGRAPHRTRSGHRDGFVPGGSLRLRSRAACAAVVWRVWTRSLKRPVSPTVRHSTGDSAGAPGLIRVDADTSPWGSEDATPGSRVCVPVRALLCRVGRAGLPGAFWCASHFLWPFCPSSLFGHLRDGVAHARVFFFLPSSLPPLAPPLSPVFGAPRPRVPLALALFDCSCPSTFFVFVFLLFLFLLRILPSFAIRPRSRWLRLFPFFCFFPCPPPPVPFVCVVPRAACCCGFLCCVSCCGCPPCAAVGCCALCRVPSGGFLWVVLCCAVPTVVTVCCAAALVPLSRSVVHVVACCPALVCVATCCAVVSLCWVYCLLCLALRLGLAPMGCCALRRCILPSFSALCAPRGVVCRGVLTRVVARRCALCCVCPRVSCCASLALSPLCGAVLRCGGLVRLRCAVPLVCAVSGARCPGAFMCAMLFLVVFCGVVLRCAAGCVVCCAAAPCALFFCVLSCCDAVRLVRCCVVLCRRACVVLPCCAILRLLCWAVFCGAACSLCWFAAGPRCPLWCPGAALWRWCP